MLISRQVNMDWKTMSMPYRTTGFYGRIPKKHQVGHVTFIFPRKSRFGKLTFVYWGRPFKKRLQLTRKDNCYFCGKPGDEWFNVRFPMSKEHRSFSTTACVEHKGRVKDAAPVPPPIHQYDFKGRYLATHG